MAVSFPPFTSVAVFGGIAVDRIAVTTASPTLGASNPGTVRAAPGGVGFNVARTLARLGLKVRLAAVVGDDPDGRTALAAAKAAGVDAGLTFVDPRLPTASYQAVFDDKGGLVVGVADTAVYEKLAPADMAAAAGTARNDGLWVIDANFPHETIAFLLGEAEAAGRPVSALPISPAKAVRFAMLDRRPPLLFANRREAAAMLGRPLDIGLPDAGELAGELDARGFANVLVTDSAEPLHVVSAGERLAFTPPSTRVASVNGAGDAFAAGTIYGLSLGKNLFEAVRSGLAAAALTVESHETVRSDLTPALLAGWTAEDVAS